MRLDRPTLFLLLTSLPVATSSSSSSFRKRRPFGIFSAVTAAARNSGNSSREWWDEQEDDDVDTQSSYNRYQEEDEEDNEDDDDDFGTDAALHPLLQIPAALALSGVLGGVEPMAVRTFLDTGAMRTVMSWSMAQRLGVAQHLDRRYSGEATGIGSTRVLGRLPAGLFVMHLSGGTTTAATARGYHDDEIAVRSPAITILESTGLPGVELLLGLDFLREYRAVLDLRVNQVRLLVDGKEWAVPFSQNDKHCDYEKSKYYDDDEDDDGDDDNVDLYDRWGNKDTSFHYDTAELYDDKYLDEKGERHHRYLDEEGGDDEDSDGEDWPDMSGI